MDSEKIPIDLHVKTTTGTEQEKKKILPSMKDFMGTGNMGH